LLFLYKIWAACTSCLQISILLLSKSKLMTF
jgi:hypothetical protein